LSYDAFISYHRESGAAEARLIQSSLQARGVQCFLDVSDLTAASEAALLQQIAEIPNFIVVLPPSSLDRCHEAQDWLRREISQAVATGSNIIPVRLPGFSFPQDVPDDIRDLPRYHGVEYDLQNFDGMLAEIVAAIGTPQPLKLQYQPAAPVVPVAPAALPSFNWTLAGMTFLAVFLPTLLNLFVQRSPLMFQILGDGFFLSIEVALIVTLFSQWVKDPFAIAGLCGLTHAVATYLVGALFFPSFRLFGGGAMTMLWGALVPGSIAVSRIPQAPRWMLAAAPLAGALIALMVGVVLGIPGFQNVAVDVTRFFTPLLLGVAFAVGIKRTEKSV
jgi:hypothetical protein